MISFFQILVGFIWINHNETRPNEFGSMSARKDDTGPFKSIFYHKAYQKFQNMIPYDNESKTNTFALRLYKKTKN